jgi:protein SCO1/2
MILMKSKKDIIINAGIFAAIIVGYIIVTFFTAQPEVKTLSFESVGLQAPLKSLSGAKNSGDQNKVATLKQFRGQPLLINFWASWCKACELEKGRLDQLAKNFSGSSIKMIGIASTDTLAALEKSGKLDYKNYPQYLDEDGSLALALDVKTLPQTLLIDSQGRVLSHFKRTITDEEVVTLEKQMTALNGVAGVLGEVPKFNLVSSKGEKFDNSRLQNKIWVADFIFTSCPDQCPLLTSKMRQLQEMFSANDKFRLVSVSVDPNKDTPQVLQKYEEKYGVDQNKWYFLTGKYGAIKKLLAVGFKLGTPEEPDLHTTKFVLVDGLGKIRGYYDSDSLDSIEKLKYDINHLLKENL